MPKTKKSTSRKRSTRSTKSQNLASQLPKSVKSFSTSSFGYACEYNNGMTVCAPVQQQSVVCKRNKKGKMKCK